MPKILHRYCPNCFTDNSDVDPALGTQPDWPLKRCRKCGFVYLERVIAYEELKQGFAQLSWDEVAHATRAINGRITRRGLEYAWKSVVRICLKRDKLLSLVACYIGEGPILDVGCGDGDVLARLSPRFLKIGIEISETLAQKAKWTVPRATIINDDAISGMRRLYDTGLRGIIMSSFLDYEIEPRLLLHETYQIVSAGGVVILKVQNYNCWRRKLSGSRWRGFRLPERVNYFTPTTIVSMARSIGFGIRRFRFDDRWPANDNMWAVLEKPASALPRTTSPNSRRRCTRLEWI